MPHIVFVVFPPNFGEQIEKLKTAADALIKNGASTEVFYAEKSEKIGDYSLNVDILEKKFAAAGGELILFAVADFISNQTFSRLACRLDTECFTNVFNLFEEDGVFFAEKKVCASNLDMRIFVGKASNIFDGDKVNFFEKGDGKRIFVGKSSNIFDGDKVNFFEKANDGKVDKTANVPSIITVAAAEKTERIAFVGGRGLHPKHFERLQKLVEKMSGQAFLTRAAALDMQSFLEKCSNSEMRLASEKAIQSTSGIQSFLEKSTKIHPSQYIVGQSGRTIAPDACITFGVSGAAAFMAGISRAKKLIAVNTDRDAPIFNYADFGIVADAEEILTEFEKIAEEF
jgi:electron transfer flavoprotein alpha subunit